MIIRPCIVLAALALVACAGVALFVPLPSARKADSPDQAFVVVVKTRQIDGLIPVMHGHGSDKPGRVTLYKNDQSCGSAAFPVVSYVYELHWNLDARPRTARIGPIATWNLDDCTVEVSGL